MTGAESLAGSTHVPGQAPDSLGLIPLSRHVEIIRVTAYEFGCVGDVATQVPLPLTAGPSLWDFPSCSARSSLSGRNQQNRGPGAEREVVVVLDPLENAAQVLGARNNALCVSAGPS